MFLDSAADVSIVPPEFITQEDYTGETTLVKGVNGQSCLPIATTAGHWKKTLPVLVRDGFPLLGLDFPGFNTLMLEATRRMEAEKVKPCNGKIVAEDYTTTPKVTNTTDEEKMESQPEEGEEAATESTVSAVQARRQQAVEARKSEEDDQARSGPF